jgi:hypothetical protein
MARSDEPAPNHALSAMLLPGSGDLQLIVELSGPSVVESVAADQAGRGLPGRRPDSSLNPRLNLSSAAALAHRQRIAAEQRLLADRITGAPGSRVERGLDVVMNALIVRAPPSDYLRIRRLPGVRTIYFSRPFRLLLDSSAILHEAQGLWDRTGGRTLSGKGVKIGIIDTGIDIGNPMFREGASSPPMGYPKGEPDFTNSKVIVARNYIRLLPGAQTVQSALDEVGHGTFVAGVAAGNLVDAPLATISGMAPGAFLGSYKIFGTPGINDFTTTAAIIAAINDAVTDGMDVLNLSLGSLNYLPPAEDPEIAALESAIKAGVVVVAAAGNDGPSAHTIENPGAAPDVITVGSVTNARTFVSHLHVTAPGPIPGNLAGIAYLPGDGPLINAQIPSTAVIDVATLDGTGQSCGPLPSGSLMGALALVLRKPCAFAAKVANAAAAGAAGVIVYNNNPAEGPVAMAGLGTTTIPAVMISNADGTSLKQFIAAHPGSVQVEIDSRQQLAAAPTTARVVSIFSSVGPGTDFGVKPDLVAVGENVYSAAQSTNPKGVIYSPTGFILGAGTSFSTPMVAGAAAGLKELLPQLDSLGIKSVLTSTASRNVSVDGTNLPSVIQAGSGLLDMASASQTGAVFTPASLNFGAVPYDHSLSLTRTFTIRNILASADQYEVTVQPIVPGPAIALSRSTTDVVSAGGATDIGLTLKASAPQTGGFQGIVTIRSLTTGSTYSLPYWAGFYVPDATRVLRVGQNQNGTDAFSNLADALAAARPGNVIEIADSGTYPAGFTIGTNAEGLPLHGLTIRAAPGQAPTLDGSTVFNAPGNIRISGLRNVLIQGVKINGGITGILLMQASTSVPLSVTFDHCVIDATSGAGIVAFSGATVEVTQSVVSNSSGTGIVQIGGTLTLTGSTIKNNAADGIDALGVNVDILNSTITGNTGPGLNALGSSGTIDGSTFSLNHGKLGDGVEIVDGTVTLTNNTFESNERAGIAFLGGGDTGSGPTAVATGNIVRGNQLYGVLAAPGQNLRLDGNLISDNGCGIRTTGFTTATLVNNLILRSSDPISGDGIEIAGNSSVRAVNDTIFKNALHGIIVDPTASASVYNTILSGNGKGDLLGLPETGIRFSLVGDGSAAGNNNLSGDPKFTDPSRDDFSLLIDSPARGAGTSAAPGLPFLDYSRRSRAETSLTVPPSVPGQVDMGAIESNSTYPIPFPILANGTQVELDGPVVTGLAVLNSGGSAGTAAFAGYTGVGAPLPFGSGSAVEAVGAASQIPILASQLFGYDNGSSVLGSILASSTQPLTGFLFLFDPDFARFATGVSVSSQTLDDLVFMRHLYDATGKARYVLFNPGTSPAKVSARLYSPSGTAIGIDKTASLSPKEQWVFEFDDVTTSSGSVRVTSDRPLAGLEVFGDAQGMTALAPSSQGSESRLFFPHIAANQGFSTQIGVVNPNATPVSFIFTAYDDNGNVLGTPASAVLEGNSQLLEDVNSLFGLTTGALQTGYVIAQGDQAGAVGFTLFGYAGGTKRAFAAVPADSVPLRHMVFSHVANQVPAGAGRTYQTGVALLNPFGAAVEFTLSVFDGTGKLVAQKSETLSGHQKIARFLSQAIPGAGYFTQPISLGSGHIEISSDYGLLGLELFFTEDFSQLAAVPALPPALLK